MLTIRNAQLEVLALQSKLYRFLKEHLLEYFPEQMAVREDNIISFIEKGISKASKYGIEDGIGICKFMDLMVILGDSFDEESHNQWFMEILKDSSNGTPTDRISQVANLVAFSRA